MNIIYVRSHPVNPEPRLEKEAKTMRNAGHNIWILGWRRYGNAPLSEGDDTYSISRFGLKAPIGKKVVLYWPIWWIYEAMWLFSREFDVVHVADFDTYLPALFVSKLKGKKIIYDIYDFYPDTVSLPRFLYCLFKRIDLFFMKFADKIIIVDDCRRCQINLERSSNVLSIYNTPMELDTIPLEEHLKSRSNESTFRIFFGGVIHPDRDVTSMVKLAIEETSIILTIAGSGNPEIINHVQKASTATSNINFLGVIPYADVLSQSYSTDILFALYDPAIPNNRLASPNKLFEAMMCGKPIIVNEGVATADKVREENCGLVVPYGDYEALKEAVLTLKNNPELRKELGENGRRAYETKYNWKIMEKRLLDLYASLEEKQ